MSSAVAERASGASSATAVWNGPQSLVHGVRTNPGATALMRTGPDTLASRRVRWLSAAFDTAYGIELPVGRRPAIDVTFTTTPAELCLRCGSAARVRYQVPSRLVSRMR